MTRIETLSVNGYTVYANDIEEPYTVIEPWPSNKVHAVWTESEIRRIVGYSRAQLAAMANEAAQASTIGGAPILTADSDRATVAEWLQWNDPDGIHSDAAVDAAPESEGAERYTETFAWETLRSMLED